MSYYPIAPGQDLDRFSNEEAQRAIQAFNELVDPPRNKSFLTRGTALIIPLGKGKYEAIIEDTNIANVRARLGGFASITADQERNEGKSLKHIYVMGKEVLAYVTLGTTKVRAYIDAEKTFANILSFVLWIRFFAYLCNCKDILREFSSILAGEPRKFIW